MKTIFGFCAFIVLSVSHAGIAAGLPDGVYDVSGQGLNLDVDLAVVSAAGEVIAYSKIPDVDMDADLREVGLNLFSAIREVIDKPFSLELWRSGEKPVDVVAVELLGDNRLDLVPKLAA